MGPDFVKKHWMPLVLIVVGFLIYAGTFNNQLFLDDSLHILENRYLRDWNYLDKYFTESLTAGAGISNFTWRPALLISWSIVWHFFEYWPSAYHFLNIAAHAASGVLLFLLFGKLLKNRITAFVLAALFLAHPVQTESINHATFLGEPLGTVFFLLTAIFYLNRRINLSLLMMGLALLAKETAVIAPILIFLTDFFFISSPRPLLKKIGRSVKNAWPFFALAAIYIVLRLTVLNFEPLPDFYNEIRPASSWASYVFWIFHMTPVYLKLIFWPADLYFGRDAEIAAAIASPSYSVILGGAVLAALLAGAVFLVKKKPIISFGIFWFFTALAPSYSPLSPKIWPASEHLLYLPLAGALLAIAGLIGPFIAKKNLTKFSGPVFLIVFSLLAGRTIIRNQDWQDPVRFFSKILERKPNNYRALNNLGLAYSEASDYERSEEFYKKAALANPEKAVAHSGLARLYQKNNRLNLALEQALTADRLLPENYFLKISLANIYLAQQNHKKAEDIYQRAILIDPRQPDAHYNLGSLYQQTGKIDAAIEKFFKVIELNPNFAQSYKKLVEIYIREDNIEKIKMVSELAVANLRGAEEGIFLEIIRSLR